MVIPADEQDFSAIGSERHYDKKTLISAFDFIWLLHPGQPNRLDYC